MEAGLEHLSRSTTRGSDLMLVIAEPYYKSLETAARVHKMAAELGIPRTYLVANKVRTLSENRAIQTFAENHAMEIIVTIPYDEKVAEASLIPIPPLDAEPEGPGVLAIKALAAEVVSANN